MGRRRRQGGQGEVGWGDYDRVTPGKYRAYCGSGSVYCDRAYKRWTAILRFALIAPNGVDVVARVPMWLALGGGQKPHAPRRGRYFQEWVRANGGPPIRGDRLSVRVFTRRMVIVIVGDTDGAAPYSVVKEIVSWETGSTCQSVSSHSVKEGSKKAPENEPLPNDGCQKADSENDE